MRPRYSAARKSVARLSVVFLYISNIRLTKGETFLELEAVLHTAESHSAGSCVMSCRLIYSPLAVMVLLTFSLQRTKHEITDDISMISPKRQRGI